jgi:tetratricopeptide (TPR) repeat protein
MLKLFRILSRSTCVCVVMFYPSYVLFAEEIDWRTDYNKARQEAAEKGRPLFLDFGTENCFWCKQLDVRTFIDADLIALLNRRYIPVKVDGNRNPGLTDALHIQNYPTLVYASPDGRILGFQEGFVEAAKLKDVLKQSLMANDYEEALKARKDARTAQAVSLLKNIVDDGKDRPIQSKARTTLQAIEQESATAYSKAKELLEAGKVEEGTKDLNEVIRTYAGTQGARDAQKLLATPVTRADKDDSPSVRRDDSQSARRAKELLTEAREDFRMQQFLRCLDRCEMLMAAYSELPEASEAAQLASEIKSNPEWTRQVCDQMGDRLSLLYLALAETSLKRGQPQQAVFYFERIVQTFPGSRHAETASIRLTQLQGQPKPSENKKQ